MPLSPPQPVTREHCGVGHDAFANPLPALSLSPHPYTSHTPTLGVLLAACAWSVLGHVSCLCLERSVHLVVGDLTAPPPSMGPSELPWGPPCAREEAGRGI